MSTYQHKLEFIERTQRILSELGSQTKYEKTMFLNCCLGLLVVPQQWKDTEEEKKFIIDESVSLDKWGIDKNSLQDITNVPRNGFCEDAVENIAYHIRNSLAHYHFDIMKENTEAIKRITIVDYSSYPDKKSFECSIDFENLVKFVTTYADEKIKLIKIA